jgi:hypothetical protein
VVPHENSGQISVPDVITVINLLTYLRAKKLKSEDDMLCHMFILFLRLILCTAEPSVRVRVETKRYMVGGVWWDGSDSDKICNF